MQTAGSINQNTNNASPPSAPSTGPTGAKDVVADPNTGPTGVEDVSTAANHGSNESSDQIAQAADADYPASAAAKKEEGEKEILILEYCCSPNSNIGNPEISPTTIVKLFDVRKMMTCEPMRAIRRPFPI